MFILSHVKRLDTGFRIAIWFTGLFQSATASNYNRFTNLRTLQFTVGRTKSSQLVFTGRRLVTAPNNLDSSASVFNGSCPCWLATLSHLTYAPNVLTYSIPGPQLSIEWLTAKLLVALSNTAFLGSESHGTNGRILLSNNSESLQNSQTTLLYCCVRIR
jgi:hypothetical protein